MYLGFVFQEADICNCRLGYASFTNGHLFFLVITPVFLCRKVNKNDGLVLVSRKILLQISLNNTPQDEING